VLSVLPERPSFSIGTETVFINSPIRKCELNTVNLKGTYSELGRQHGSFVKGFFHTPPIPEKKIEFSKKCELLTRQYTPKLMDEVEAFAESAELDLEPFKAFLLTLGLEPGCSVFALGTRLTETGIPIFCRNYDWDYEFQDYFMAFITEPQGGVKNLSFSDHMIGRYGGVNKEGVAVSIHAVPGYTGKPRPGVRMNMTLRWILDNMKSTEEAVEFITETPHQTAHLYMVADKKGDFARIEYAPEELKVEYGDIFLYCTNHYQLEEMKKYETGNFDRSNTEQRETKIRNWRDTSERFSHEDVVQLLSSHNDGVCNHAEYKGIKYGTIWSWIAPLGEDIAYVCHGSPCRNKYMEITY
jgi:predicted choloylglycine hydrolase